MPRVLQVINSLNRGGAERFVFNLVRSLDKNKFECEVLCLYDKGDLAESLLDSGVRVSNLNLSKKLGSNVWFRTWQAIRESQPDILHTHLPEACWLGLPTGWASRIQVRVAHVQNCNRNWPRKIRLLDRVASAFATDIIACAHAVKNFCQEELKYRKSIHVVHNSIDLDEFSSLPGKAEGRRTLGLSNSDHVVICVASLTTQKGQRYLLAAMSDVLKQNPGSRLLIVGDGPDRASLEEEVKRRGMANNILFLGKRRDIPLLLSMSDLLVLPSLWEGLPMVLAEAAAAGLPVVATAVDGTPEVVEHGETGILVSPARADELASAITILLTNGDERLTMGNRARAKIHRDFDISNSVGKVQEIYEKALG